MSRAILVDENKCFGCYACITACRAAHDLPPYPLNPPEGGPQGPELIRINMVGPEVTGDKVSQYFPAVVCRHCPDAPCIEECPTDAIYKDAETGLVLVDQEKCTGCELCLPACPYGAPQFYDDKMYLCDLCFRWIGEREKTACEAACPAGAIGVGTTAEAW